VESGRHVSERQPAGEWVVNNGLSPEATELEQGKHAIVLCGDILPSRRFLSDSASAAAGLTIVRCSEDSNKIIAVITEVKAYVMLAGQAFLEKLPPAIILQLFNLRMDCRVLAVLESDTIDPSSATKMLRIGCRGLLPRRFSRRVFRRAVWAVLKGELWAPRRLVSDLLSELLVAASQKDQHGLTPQELRILELSSKGYPNAAIADALFISTETVRWHKRHLNRKLRENAKPKLPETQPTPLPRHVAAS